MSEDGSRLAVSAYFEGSNTTGINGDESNNVASQAGAVYMFSRSGTTWTQEAYIKASNTDSGDNFGRSVSLSNDDSKLAVGAPGEDSNATGINGNQADNTVLGTGAVYIFSRTGITWSQQAYIKASNPDYNDIFGERVTISGDGTRIISSAPYEESDARGFNGNETNNYADASGAAYVFSEVGAVWSQTSYLKSSNSEAGDLFSFSVSCNIDGTLIAVGARFEASNATGIDGDQTNNSFSISGAVYLFQN